MENSCRLIQFNWSQNYCKKKKKSALAKARKICSDFSQQIKKLSSVIKGLLYCLSFLTREGNEPKTLDWQVFSTTKQEAIASAQSEPLCELTSSETKIFALLTGLANILHDRREGGRNGAAKIIHPF